MENIAYWIENPIDLGYNLPILKIAQDTNNELILNARVGYRPLKMIFNTVVDFLGFLQGGVPAKTVATEFDSIIDLMKTFSREGTVLITGYNLNKYTEKQVGGIKFILIGHSHLGPVRYNNISYLYKKFEFSKSLVPLYYSELFESMKKQSHHRFYSSYYKNIKHIEDQPQFKDMGRGVLFLPHWTLPMSEIEEKVYKLREVFPDEEIYIKLHPNLEVELLKAMHMTFRDVKERDGSITTGKSKRLLSEAKDRLSKINAKLMMASEMSLNDAIDMCHYHVFDGGSSTLVESILRNGLYHESKKKYLILNSNYLESLQKRYDEDLLSLNNPSNKVLAQLAKKYDDKCTGNVHFNWTTFSDNINVPKAYGINLVNTSNLTIDSFKPIDPKIMDLVVPSKCKYEIAKEFFSSIESIVKEYNQ